MRLASSCRLRFRSTIAAVAVRRSGSISLHDRCEFANKEKKKKESRGESTVSREKEIAQSSEERCCGLSIIVTITIIFLIIMRIIINDNYR